MNDDLSPDRFRGELAVVLAGNVQRYAAGDGMEAALLVADLLMQLTLPTLARMNDEQRETVLAEANRKIQEVASLFEGQPLVVVWAVLAGLMKSVGEHQPTDNLSG